MNVKLIKNIAASVCILSGLAMSFQSGPKSGPGKTAESAKAQELVITSPEKASEYGVGAYKVEGVAAKGTEVTLFLDRKELKTFTTNTEDGSFLEEIKVSEAGEHTLVAQFKDGKGQKSMKKLEFKAKDEKNSSAEEEGDQKGTDKEPSDYQPGAEDDEVVNNEPDANNEALTEPAAKPVVKKPAVKKPTSNPAPAAAEDPKDPNSAANREANGVKPKVPTGKKPVAKKPVGKKPVAPAAFGISSYTNFNVVPHGVLQVGGKGKPGDKVMVYVDKKLAMKGTIKSNGRWKFPVKVAAPGFRVITAQNLRTKESKSVKLKIQ